MYSLDDRLFLGTDWKNVNELEKSTISERCKIN